MHGTKTPDNSDSAKSPREAAPPAVTSPPILTETGLIPAIIPAPSQAAGTTLRGHGGIAPNYFFYDGGGVVPLRYCVLWVEGDAPYCGNERYPASKNRSSLYVNGEPIALGFKIDLSNTSTNIDHDIILGLQVDGVMVAETTVHVTRPSAGQ